MNRLETIALFTALAELSRLNQHDSVDKVIQAVLKEAQREENVQQADSEKRHG